MMLTPVGTTPDISSALPTVQPSKTQRVLACVLCQQRKVKCDRKYPCSHCIKARVQCVPATQVSRRRRRRFPERELLERLRKYEDLLRQNNIKFEPLHKSPPGDKDSPYAEGSLDSDNDELKTSGVDSSSPLTTLNSEPVYDAMNIWHAMTQEFRDPNDNDDSSDDEVPVSVVKEHWEELLEDHDHFLFGSRQAAVDISTLHPEPVQIFRLWQVYLENVDPLLKVTHTSSLQGRIIEAAGNVSNIRRNLEALMFSIYCMSILSLTEEDCQTMFGSSRRNLLTKYQFGCEQALLNSGFLRTNDCDCLTALFLYLVSFETDTIPHSVSSILGIAIRIAQRMGIHSESVLANCTPLEAEMRRRLWWSLILFDNRMAEMSNAKTTMLTPLWDCKIPLNVNDAEFRPEMKGAPQVQGKSTEALFAVVRGELGDFVRHSMFHLNFTNPALKSVAKNVQHGSFPQSSELGALENMIEDKYLKFCDSENPLHFMTIWMTRGYLAKCRLLEYYSKISTSAVHQTEAQRDAAISNAFSMLECDTKIITSPLAKGFRWMVQIFFPFTAYLQISQHLRRRPFSDQAEKAWEIMSDNFEARFDPMHKDDIDSPVLKIFTRLVVQTWEPREATFKQSGSPLVIPRIVKTVKHILATARNGQKSDTRQPNGSTDMGINDFPMSMPTNFGGDGSLYNTGMQDGYAVPGQWAYSGMSELTPLDAEVNQLDWSAMDWDLVKAPTGGTGELTGLPLPNFTVGSQDRWT